MQHKVPVAACATICVACSQRCGPCSCGCAGFLPRPVPSAPAQRAKPPRGHGTWPCSPSAPELQRCAGSRGPLKPCCCRARFWAQLRRHWVVPSSDTHPPHPTPLLLGNSIGMRPYIPSAADRRARAPSRDVGVRSVLTTVTVVVNSHRAEGATCASFFAACGRQSPQTCWRLSAEQSWGSQPCALHRGSDQLRSVLFPILCSRVAGVSASSAPQQTQSSV